MKASDLFVQCLEAEWVHTIFWVPGEENLDMVESLKNSSIELIVTRNEQSAVFMAATQWRLTGKAWVALSTLGPGATNLMTGVAYAQLWGLPVILITGQKPVRKTKQGQFQVIDVVEMMKPVTKHSSTIASIHNIPSTIRHAWKLAEAEKPWAVHIELPEDIARETSTDTLKPLPVHPVRRPIIDEKVPAQLVEHLEHAKHPIILIGPSANRKRVTKYLTEFITKYNIPFFTSQMGKGVVDETLPQCLGTAALTSDDHIHEAIALSDCIIAVGHDTVEKPTYALEDTQVALIHIDFSPAEVTQLYAPTYEAVWDIAHTFRQLATQCSIDTSSREFAEIYSIRNAYMKTIQLEIVDAIEHNEHTPLKLISALQSTLEPDDTLCLDNGLYKVWIARNYLAKKPNTVLLDNALATMGAWYSSWIWVALHKRARWETSRIVCVTWDWWVVMNLWDLITAARLEINMTIILLNDEAYGMIQRKQAAMGFAERNTKLTNPNFDLLAQSFGIHYTYVSVWASIEDAIERSFATGWVHLIELPFVYPSSF